MVLRPSGWAGCPWHYHRPDIPCGIRKRNDPMNKFIRRAVTAALVSTASVTAVTVLMPAYAAPAKKPDPKVPEGPKVRPVVGKPLNDAVKLVNMKDFAGALAKVNEA